MKIKDKILSLSEIDLDLDEIISTDLEYIVNKNLWTKIYLSFDIVRTVNNGMLEEN
jgi:hypothetical protein